MLDFFQQLALDKIGNETYIYKFGRNAAVGASEVILAGGGVYGLPTSAKTVKCTSTDGNDIVGGSGARSIHIFGLDADYNRINEVVNMGASTVNEYLRVFRAHVETAGTTTPTGGGNKGVITIAQDESAIEMVKIDIGDGQTLVSCYTVPAGLTALIWSADVTTGEGKNATARLKSREFGSDIPFRVKGIRDSFENTARQQFKIPGVYPEKSDIVFTAISTAAGTPCSGTFLLELVNNNGVIG